MKPFLKQHLREALAVAALVFLGIIAAYFIWGIMTISLALSQATTVPPPGPDSATFNLQGARGLNLRGLIQ